MVSDLDRHDPPLSVDLKAQRLRSRFLSNAPQWCPGSNRGVGNEPLSSATFQPGKPDENAFIERFNRTARTEVLIAYVFESLEQVREISAAWWQSDNEERPHDELAGLAPATYRAQLEGRSSPLPLSH
jgi:putative transposase